MQAATEAHFDPNIPTAELAWDDSGNTAVELTYVSSRDRENTLFRRYVRALARAASDRT